MSSDSGYDSKTRKQVVSELTMQGLVALGAIITLERVDWELQPYAYAAVTSDLETDRAQASGIEAWYPRVKRAEENRDPALDTGGLLRALSDRYLPALFGAELNTTTGKEWWMATIGTLPCSMPAVHNVAGRKDAILKRVELFRTVERTCIVLLQDAGAPNGCGTRLAAVPGGGAESLGVCNAEEFLAGIVEATGLSEEQVFGTWTKAADRPGCDFGVLLRLARRSGKDVEYTDFSDSGCFPKNSVTVSVGEQLYHLFSHIKDFDEAVECVVGWRDLNGFLVQEVLSFTKRDFESPPSHQGKVGSRDANGCVEYLKLPLPGLCARLFWQIKKAGAPPVAPEQLSRDPRAVGASSLWKTVHSVSLAIPRLLCPPDQICGTGANGLGWACKPFGSGTIFSFTPSRATFLGLVVERILGDALVEGVVGTIMPYLVAEPSSLRSGVAALLDSPLLHEGTALADFLVHGSWENNSQSADNFVSGVRRHFKPILDSALAENLLALVHSAAPGVESLVHPDVRATEALLSFSWMGQGVGLEHHLAWHATPLALKRDELKSFVRSNAGALAPLLDGKLVNDWITGLGFREARSAVVAHAKAHPLSLQLPDVPAARSLPRSAARCGSSSRAPPPRASDGQTGRRAGSKQAAKRPLNSSPPRKGGGESDFEQAT
ncbi:hypothetical protein EMIHUDRAFT_455351 [Emiliania huxleyi CCMP1516]|uniref:Uncharacterized protein n=2 Tax=Emiliania huxleyi TaxID=2903 RepID=A0A0D3KHP3_EMIH1|nr:hypothetical protein EMIHUDRAFT_455351 [Emiliania huxleyi CCMP1516]EOD35278.1 hypothetical protein EMIHUDRAFT_455351 [Emiliania huxleyi CCMP1516]|eukprot:XP_005787707.1 hypothetical protein EMIHUDRAFT_455351 [Emiliania huxleyi CCMP1516]